MHLPVPNEFMQTEPASLVGLIQALDGANMRIVAALLCTALLGCGGENRLGQGVVEAREDATQAVAAESATRDELAEFCINKKEATLAGVGTFSPAAAVESLGVHISREAGTGEDDGGIYTTSILTFPRVIVHVDDRGYGIERVETRDSSLALPSGVRVGMLLAEAQDRLRVPRGARDLATLTTERVWTGALCEATTPATASEYAQVRLYIGEAGMVELIALTNHGP